MKTLSIQKTIERPELMTYIDWLKYINSQTKKQWKNLKKYSLTE